MSGRGSRKRGRPPKTPNERVTKFNYNLLKKPKYLSKHCESQSSTPSASRASSPTSDASRSQVRKYNKSQKSVRGGGAGRGRKFGGTSFSRRGFESEYHYGSEFGDSSEDKSDIDTMFSASEDEDLDAVHESESDFSVCSFTQAGVGRPPRPPSPDPVWLQDRDYPALILPESSEDLLIGNDLILSALGIYEVLRRFRHLVRLSPFRFEDFCGALICDEQTALLSEIHIMLLKAILREEDVQGTHFAPLDQKDTVNISLYLIDNITWPEVLRSYVESDALFDRQVYGILATKDYPFTSVDDRLNVLQFLTDQFLTTNAVRDVMVQEGPIHYDDHCRVCHRLGDLLCCETCPAVYHLECVDPPMLDVPTEDWQCSLCKSHKVVGVVDCVLPQEKQGVLIRHEPLGLDRHGRKFWFMTRRIIVEDQLEEKCWYYSTAAKFELLLQLLDKDDLECALHAQLLDKKEEIVRQLKLNEQLTNEQKLNRKSCLEQEIEALQPLLGQAAEEQNDAAATEAAENNKMITRQKLNQLSNGNIIFKLGMENGFKSYVNQYAINAIALNKPQRNEERDKRRHLSHKFSLTTASEFKWSGLTIGSLDNIKSTLRQSLLHFEQNINIAFMNPNWPSLKKIWHTTVLHARKPADFATVLLLLQSSFKSVLFANVWHEQLGHISLKRITAAEREERKKLEKREKRERDDEEERNRLAFNYVKYSLGLRHQVWKQKGEEYRVHGQWDWMWLSTSRRTNRTRQLPARTESMPTDKVALHYTNGTDKNEVVKVDPRTHMFFLECRRNIEKGCDYAYLQRFKHIKLIETQIDSHKNDIIDVSAALASSGRLLYPKIGRKSRLNDLLAKRLELKEAEEKIANKLEIDTSNKTVPSIFQKFNSHTFLERRIVKILELQKVAAVQEINVDLGLVNALAKKIQKVRVKFSTLNRFSKQHRCYTRECNAGSNAVSQITQTTCYSSLCLQKARAKKNLLVLLRKAHSAGQGSKETIATILGAVKKPSILEQKLSEGKKDNNAWEYSDNMKTYDETPIDIVQDFELAQLIAVPFDEKLLIDDCFIADDDEPCTTMIKKEEPNEESMTSAPDFIENMDVCSNVEIESSEATPEFTLPGLLPMPDDMDASTSKKYRKSPKNRNKSIAPAKDAMYSFHEEEIPNQRQNRRFPTNPRLIKREEIKCEKEYYEDGKERIYAAASPKRRIYLLRHAGKLLEQPPEQKNAKAKDDDEISTSGSKYPLISNFLTHKYKKNLLLLPRYELCKLARLGGKIPVNGFHHLAKNNTNVWPYPCSRPLFKSCWSYRTTNAATIAAIALQVRILWSCLRWDDMIAKPPSADGKQSITSETETVTLELLKMKNSGRFGEKTHYLRRKILIPFEMPKTIREVTSIRSGLRKRKRAESPQPSEPQISEEWIEEEKLDLWEIKFIGDKLERNKLVATTRSATQRQVENTAGGSNTATGTAAISNGGINKMGGIAAKSSGEDGKDKTSLDQHHNIKYTRGGTPLKKVEISVNKTTVTSQVKTTPQIIGTRRVLIKNPDGTTRFTQQTVTSATKTNTVAATSVTPAVLSSNYLAGTTAATSAHSSTSNAAASTQHKVQIIRGPDGKVSVRGLNPGQQLIQMPDGKLHVLTTQQLNAKTKMPVKTTTLSQTVGQSPITKQLLVKQIPKTTTVQASQKITVNATQTTVPTKITQQPLAASTNKSVQQLVVQPVQKIIVGSNAQGQKVILSQTQQQQPQTQQQVVVNQLTAAGNQTATATATTTSSSSSTSTPQKVIQQIVNTSNVQQQIMLGGQRIVLSPGQTIVTQRSIAQNQLQVVQQQVLPQQQQTRQVTVQPQVLGQTATKLMKPVVLQQQQQQQASQQQQQLLQEQNSAAVQTNVSAGGSANQQIVVQNATLAQQLAQGKLQVATVNGQQVIIKPLGNNQAQIVAHIKTQSDGTAHIVTNNTLDLGASLSSGTKATTTNSLRQRSLNQQEQFAEQQQQQIQNAVTNAAVNVQQQEAQQQQQQQQQEMSVEESLLQGQPPGTIIKCVTAQVIQTDQGPRIVLQGLVGNDFTQQQLLLVQQQVKQQLLKAQESSGKQGVLGPTKIYLAVQPPTATNAGNTQPPPLTPVHQQTAQQQGTIMSSFPKALKAEQKEDISKTLLHTLTNSNNNTTATTTATITTTENSFIQSAPTIQSQNTRNANANANVNTNFIVNSASAIAIAGHNLYKKRSRKRSVDGDWNQNVRPKPILQKQQQLLFKHKDTGNDLFLQTSRNQNLNTELNNFLEQHKDLLKRNILKKRSLLERNIQTEIKSNVAAAKNLPNAAVGVDKIDAEQQQQQQQQQQQLQPSELNVSIPQSPVPTKRRFQTTTPGSKTSNVINAGSTKTTHNHPGRPKKFRRKKEKLYCICRTPYDETKFYVGCDLCSNWFHGDCVNISEEASKQLSEFICNDCKRARETQELYCSCRQPYDESQFYICCDKCQGWFHGRCVGIVQSEAEFIDEYVCPECQKNNDVNLANMQDLTEQNKEDLKELVNNIKCHKSAWPFMEPVDPHEAPDYYKVIKEPMDLQQIENKLHNNIYKKLTELIGDMTKMFDNCRYYNPKESSFYKCAETLELYFVHKIKNFRERVVVSH